MELFCERKQARFSGRFPGATNRATHAHTQALALGPDRAKSSRTRKYRQSWLCSCNCIMWPMKRFKLRGGGSGSNTTVTTNDMSAPVNHKTSSCTDSSLLTTQRSLGWQNMGATGGSDFPQDENTVSQQEFDSIQTEVRLLRRELRQSRDSIAELQQREKALRDRLSEQAQKRFNVKGSTKFEDLSLGENRPSQLIRRFGNLYSEGRVDAFDALDALPEMAEFDDLKGKLLFSVVVLAFRSVQNFLQELRENLRHLLCLPVCADTSSEAICLEMEDSISVYMRKSIGHFDVSRCIEEVSGQVCATLYDYPTLKTCEGLRVYIEECVHLSWAMSVQSPPMVIDYDSSVFKADMHTRFHSSDPESCHIKIVLWPALLEGENGPCVHKGVVIT